jgi:hypothetical protein
MAPPLPAGKYKLTLGLYGEDRKRWALDGLGEPTGRDEYMAAEVDVPAQQPNPRFAFSAAWLPVEPGGDLQALARRWMAKLAAIRLLHQRGPGTVWMIVHIPPTNTTDFRMVLDPGASAPSVRVAGNCGGTEANLTGPGLHEVELATEPLAPDGFCRVLLSTNFILEPVSASVRKRSVSLENIAWIPQGRAGRRARRPGPKTTSPTAPQ